MQFNAKKRERPIGHTNVILGHENGHVPYHRDHVARLPVTQKIKQETMTKQNKRTKNSKRADNIEKNILKNSNDKNQKNKNN